MSEQNLLSLLNERYGLSLNSISFLREGGGKAYVAEGPAEKYLLKIVSPAFRDTVRQSASVMQYLSGRGFPTPKVIETTDGLTVPALSIDGEDRLLILYEYIEGEEPELESCAEAVGELTGRMHELLEQYPEKLTGRDGHFFIARYIGLLQQKGYANVAAYKALGAELWSRVADMPACACHGDLHRGNLLQSPDGRLWLLDFDTVCFAPRMFDVMVMCDMTDYFRFDPSDLNTTAIVYRQFLSGYTRRIPLTARERNSLFDWIAIRHFQLQATILEIHGLGCIDSAFIDRQLKWLEQMFAAAEHTPL